VSTTLPDILLSHATVLVGDRARALLELSQFFGVELTHQGDRDIYYSEAETLGIDDVRVARLRAYQKPIVRPFLYVVLSANDLTREAQNALLKITEDPPTTLRIIMVVPHTATLIPTLLSRVQLTTYPHNTTTKSLPITLKAGLAKVQELTKAKDTEGIEAYVQSIEMHLHIALARGKTLPHLQEALMLTRRYLKGSGSSPKILLENLTLAFFESSVQK
jgi:hypothetical protein